jgi:polyhydroxyalkanoate synthesis repressor PhaR
MLRFMLQCSNYAASSSGVSSVALTAGHLPVEVMSPQTIVIKKYENRRLYDSTHSRYVNLDEVAQMVRDGRDVQVLDAVTGEDRTRAVLTQIVVEHAKDDHSTFPLDVLRQMVIASGRVTNEAALTYMRGVFDMYQNAYRAVVPVATPHVAPTPPLAAAAVPGRGDIEVDALKKRLAELESVVSGIKSKRAAPKPRRHKRR